MRTATTLLVTAGLVATLAGCSAGTPTDNASADCSPVASGAVSNAVTVSGDFGKKPDVTIDFPVTAENTQRTVVEQGDGDTAVAGDVVNVNYSLYNGTTGDEIPGPDYTETGADSFPLDDAQFIVGIVKTLECSQVGSRVVGVIPPIDAFGSTGSEQLGIAADDNLVVVVDVVSIDPPAEPALPKADGVDQPAEPGFPTVVLDGDGRPTVTIPATAPPTELQLAVLKLGDGATVADGDDVTVHYEGINWNTGVIFDESWAGGKPATFNTGQVIAGFTAALVGQKVGSQVIVVIPPDQGYGEAGSPPDIGGTDTLVFVIDILGIA